MNKDWIRWGRNGVYVLLAAWLGLFFMFGYFDMYGFFTKGATLIPILFPLPFLTYFLPQIPISQEDMPFLRIPGVAVILPVIIYFIIGVVVGYLNKKFLVKRI